MEKYNFNCIMINTARVGTKTRNQEEDALIAVQYVTTKQNHESYRKIERSKLFCVLIIINIYYNNKFILEKCLVQYITAYRTVVCDRVLCSVRTVNLFPIRGRLTGGAIAQVRGRCVRHNQRAERNSELSISGECSSSTIIWELTIHAPLWHICEIRNVNSTRPCRLKINYTSRVCSSTYMCYD